MKDSEIRGRVLQFLYENRRESFIAFGAIQRACQQPQDIDLRDWLRACKQLADYALIDWHPAIDHTGQGLLGAVTQINGFGVAVVEGDAEPPISVVIDQSQTVHVSNAHGVQIAGANSNQEQTITSALEQLITAIANAPVSDAEKKETRSLLVKVLDSKAAAAVLGAGATYLAAKLEQQS